MLSRTNSTFMPSWTRTSQTTLLCVRWCLRQTVDASPTGASHVATLCPSLKASRLTSIVFGGTERRITASMASGANGRAAATAPSMTTLAAFAVPAWAARALASSAHTLGHRVVRSASISWGYVASQADTVLELRCTLL